jgi:hypothetical protein
MTLAVNPPEAAVMVVICPDVAVDTGVARPERGSIVATAVFDEVHETFVRGAVVKSANVPFAVKVTVLPWLTIAFPLVMVIPVRAEAVTVAVVEPLTEPDVAVITEVPTLRPVSNPLELMLALPGVALAQVTVFRVAILPSSLTPVADICTVFPGAVFATLGEAGVMVIDVRIGSVKKPWQATMNARVSNRAREDAIRKIDFFLDISFYPSIFMHEV